MYKNHSVYNIYAFINKIFLTENTERKVNFLFLPLCPGLPFDPAVGELV
jgi:hypothetical protein